jgi:FKBP-type peptidyl-prolyl cis-trans isomerase SlyD
VRQGEPLTYVHGEGQIVPGLEEQLEGLAAGESKAAVVAPDKGYGPRNPEAVQSVPRTAFQEAGDLKVGDMVTGQAQGRDFQARVTAVDTESITLDLNHPLAGKTLHFAIDIVEVA